MTISAVTDLAAARSGPQRSDRVRRLILSAVAALTISVSVLAFGAPAQAYSFVSSSGRFGPVYFSPTPMSMNPGRLDIPAVAVGRNGAVPASSSQRVWVIYQLERWNGGQWAYYSHMSSAPTIRQFDATVYAGAGVLYPRQAGSYRVQTFVRWGYENTLGTENLISGSIGWATSAAGELRCAASRCSAGAGFVTIW